MDPAELLPGVQCVQLSFPSFSFERISSPNNIKHPVVPPGVRVLSSMDLEACELTMSQSVFFRCLRQLSHLTGGRPVAFILELHSPADRNSFQPRLRKQ